MNSREKLKAALADPELRQELATFFGADTRPLLDRYAEAMQAPRNNQALLKAALIDWKERGLSADEFYRREALRELSAETKPNDEAIAKTTENIKKWLTGSNKSQAGWRMENDKAFIAEVMRWLELLRHSRR